MYFLGLGLHWSFSGLASDRPHTLLQMRVSGAHTHDVILHELSAWAGGLTYFWQHKSWMHWEGNPVRKSRPFMNIHVYIVVHFGVALTLKLFMNIQVYIVVHFGVALTLKLFLS